MPRTLTSRRPGVFARLLSLAAAALLCAALSAVASAQSVENTQNSADAKSRSGAKVDPATRALQFQIALGTYPGRNGTSVPVVINYSSKLWRMEYVKTDIPQGQGADHRHYYRPVYGEGSSAGWTSSLDWFLPPAYSGESVPPREREFYNLQGKAVPGPFYYRTVARMHVTLPDGSRHELRRSDTVLDAGADTTTGVFHSVDGSRLRYDSATRTLHMPDGARYVRSVDANGVPAAYTYVDRNGNTLSAAAGGPLVDTVGRTFTAPPLLSGGRPAGDYTYTLPGVGGTPMTYTFRWRHLGDAGVLTNTGEALRHRGDRNYSGQATGLDSLFTSPGGPDNSIVGVGGTFNPVMLHQIVLPDGTFYTFTYNVWGEITKAVYPAGGHETFAHGPVTPVSGLYLDEVQEKANRGVTARTLAAGGGSATTTWQYGLGTVKVTQGQTEVGPYTHTLYHTSRGSSLSIKYGFDDARAGIPYDERVYATEGGPMLRRTLTLWEYTGPVPYDVHSTATRDPRPGKVVEVLLDTGGSALYKTTKYEYDADLNVTKVKHYGFVAVDQQTAQTAPVASFSPAESALLRVDETDYLTADQAYRARNLLSLPVATRVRDGALNLIAQSETRYDETDYPLLPCGATAGRVDPGTSARGNPTTGRSWLNTPAPGTWVETRAQYDGCGNARKSRDAKGNWSEVDYSSTYQCAYPTATTSAVPDPTNGFGANYALTTFTEYDSWTGLVISSTDANGQTTTFQYNDPLNRIRRVDRPDGGWTTYEYGHSTGDYVRTLTALDGSRSVESYQFSDGLGRPSRSLLNDGGAPTFITSDTQYDALGRVWRVSNPYRTSSSYDAINPSGRWTTTAYDALGRVATVTAPDGAEVKTDYDGVRVLVTDPAGKQRVSRTDALGRLREVWEVRSADPASGTEAVTFPSRPGVPAVAAGYKTTYDYDALGNLRITTQGAQSRYFMYDSLSRLIRARNPEQAVNTALNTAADPVNGNNTQWSHGYDYDPNGNLWHRIDARNVTTTYGYDNLNRNTTVTYTNDPQNTPAVERHYDYAVNGKGRFWYTLTLGPNGSHTAIEDYDLMGRPRGQRQLFATTSDMGGGTYWRNQWWSPYYKVTHTYDKAGNVTSQTYPSGHTTAYSYDAAGRPGDDNGAPAFSGNLGDGVTRSYASHIAYDEAGRMREERFGTQTPLFHKLHHNVRGQLYDIRLSTHSWAADPAKELDWNRGALVTYYGEAAWQQSSASNNGNVTMAQHWVPSDDQTSSHNFTQQAYAYDALNRLSSVTEAPGTNWAAGAPTGAQAYDYDRYGNRTINAGATSGAGIPEPGFEVQTEANRLYAPGDIAMTDDGQRRMRYDAAGNLIKDTYTGGGARTYDAENRMTSAWGPGLYGGTYQNVYVYDASGKRVRRKAETGEVWQVYGFDGEFVAEYAPNGAPATPQKEYGYRGGELLVTARANDPQQLSAFVKDFYQAVFNRQPNGTELQSQVSTLGAASHQGPTAFFDAATLIGRTLFQSQEYANRGRNNHWFVYDLYVAFLGRAPDTGGWAAWESAAGSCGRACVLDAFSSAGNGEWAGRAGRQANLVDWLVSDHLGTPRMVADKTGSLAGITRHDYLPFGEELKDGAGGRTSGQGYAADNLRQKFTGYERDNETDLDYAQARYYAHAQGRFTAVDPLLASGRVSGPQTWNRYSYSLNNPLRFTDPSGLSPRDTETEEKQRQPPLPPPPPPSVPPAPAIHVDTGPDPLPPSVAPIPTRIVYNIGGAQIYNGRPIILPDGPNGTPGTHYTQNPVYGEASINSVVVEDQGGNIMGPETGVQVTESITPVSPDAQRAMIQSSGNTPAMRGQDGRFYDVIRNIYPTAAARDRAYSQPFDVTVNQRLYVRMPGQRAPVLTMLNQHQITNSRINTSLGKSEKWGK